MLHLRQTVYLSVYPSAFTATKLTTSPNQDLGAWKHGENGGKWGELQKNGGKWGGWGKLGGNGGKWIKMGGNG